MVFIFERLPSIFDRSFLYQYTETIQIISKSPLQGQLLLLENKNNYQINNFKQDIFLKKVFYKYVCLCLCL